VRRIEQLARGFGLHRDFAPRSRPGQNRSLEGRYTDPIRFGSVLGERMSTETALGIPTVYACIRILADTIGSTPLLTYTENPDESSRRRARDSVAWHLLHEQPNPGASPTDVWTLLATWLVSHGDAFLGKQFAQGRELVALWPIHPRDVDVGLVNGRKVYDVRLTDGRTRRYSPADIVHVMGQSFDGLRGASPLAVARTELGVALAAQSYAGAVYSNAGVPRGALKVKKALTDDAIDRLRADWNRIYGGTKNAGKVAILEEDMDFDAISMPMKDVQFVEQQQLSVQVIARIFRVPLSLIQAESPGGLTYRTAESENMQFLVHGVRPWYVRIEQALNRDPDLFPDAPLGFCEFLPDALLRVATLDRFRAYQIATGNKPWMLPSEVRASENLASDPSIDTLQAVKPRDSGERLPAEEDDDAVAAPAADGDLPGD